MINNIIEIVYWTVMLAVLAWAVIYFGFCFVRDLWANLKNPRAVAQATVSNGKRIKQYSKRMVIIHWLTLALLIVAWYLGDALVDARNEKSATLIGYIAHVLMGGTVLLVTILRLIFRGVDGMPPPAGYALMDRVAKGIHYGLYALLVLLSASGFMTVITSSVGVAFLEGNASLLPEKYTGPGIVPHAVHEVLVTVLMVVAAVHILGAIKHQFILKDGLMGRMSLRRKG